LIPPDRISRFLSYLLRHRPKEFPLSFDRQGFVGWGDLVTTVQQRFQDATENEIRDVVQNSDKKRFELRDDRIRATYGHSFPVDLGVESVEPPRELYHGTARDLVASILRDGLRPRGRQYVHLSRSLEEAIAVGKRRDPSPSVIVVDSAAAHAGGVHFYPSGELFLAQTIPARYLSLWQT
jgi:putative RNA 2'-phosphotransferase